MRIGIAAPIEMASLKAHFPGIKANEETLGLGGTAVNVLIDGFLKAGHQVTVFTLDENIHEKYVVEGQNIKVIFGHFRRSSTGKLFDFCAKEFRQIQRFINEERHDLDIVNAHWSYEFAIGTILSRLPHLITFRDNSPTILKLTKHPYRFIRMLMDFWVRKKGMAFSFNSEYLKSLIRLNGRAIPNPVGVAVAGEGRIYPEEGHTFKICFVANGWDYRKNPEAAIAAFALLRKNVPDTELHLIGHGFEEGSKGYVEMEGKNRNGNVFYHGSMPHTKLMQLMEGFDVMVHTAREESFGNNLVEAMAKGLPVVAGEKSGAVPWILNYGEAGSLVDIEDASAIAGALEGIITDKSCYERLSRKGIDNVSERFSQASVCNTYIEEFEKVIADARTTRF